MRKEFGSNLAERRDRLSLTSRRRNPKFIIAIILLVSAVVAIEAYVRNQKIHRMQGWPSTIGVVENVSVVKGRLYRNVWPVYRHRLEYSYTVGRVRYHSYVGYPGCYLSEPAR